MSMASLQTNSILELARPKLAEYLRDRTGETLSDLDAFRVYPKSFSVTTFVRAKTDRRSHDFVVKQIREHPANASELADRNQAIVEFEILSRLHPSFEGVDGCSVPRPVAVLPEVDAYVMEFVDGYLMSEDLRFARYLTSKAGFRKLANDYRLCGRWLRIFQEVTGGRRVAGPEAIESVTKRIDHRLRLIQETGDPRCGKDFRKRVSNLVEDLATELPGSEVTLAGRHGDLGPWNILVNRDEITVLDFFGYQEGPRSVDILKILVHFWFSSLHPLRSGRRIAAFRDHFLEGYGPLPEVPRAVVLLCETMHRVCGVGGVLSVRRSRWLNSIQLRRCLDSHLSWLLTDNQLPSLWPSL